jgi:probable F420-dependent oxidoreductase
MRIGVTLPQTTHHDLTHDVTAFARAAEDIGFDSLWAYERILMPVDMSGEHGLYGMPGVPWPEHYGHTTDALVTLTLAAAVTRRASLGTGVLVPGLHLPLRLARSLAALDVASGGRVIAGLGSGWSIDEFEATAPRPLASRGAALDEFLDIAAAAWGADPVAYGNDRYRLAPARVNPKPVRHIPIYLAAGNRPAFARLARRADGWLPTGVPPAQVAATLGALRAEAGRPIGCIYQVGMSVLDLGRAVEELAALSGAGVDHAYVTLSSAVHGLKDLVAAAEELYTRARAAGL